MPLPSRSCKNTSLPLERVLYSHPFSVTSCPIWPFNSLIYVCFISTSSSYMLAKGRFYLKGWAVQKEVVVEAFSASTPNNSIFGREAEAATRKPGEIDNDLDLSSS